MKIFAISVIYLFSTGLFATESREELLAGQDFYSGQSYSLIDWQAQDAIQWLDLAEWKDDTALKDQEPQWRRNLRERGLIELVGRGIECVGDCRLYRGEGYSKLRHRSLVQEGDEVVTGKDSYAWIFLLDGTMLRVSPETSISFKEINISEKVVFHHARLNFGHATWLGRQAETYQVNNLKETDSLFLPLNFFEANYFPPTPKVNEGAFYVDIPVPEIPRYQYNRANELIVKNNEWMQNKTTILFLVMPNGTVVATNPVLDAIALPGNQSFVKNRLSKEIGIEQERTTSATAYMRGYDNSSSTQMETGTWYRYDERGRDFASWSEPQQFSVIEYLSARIPTLIVARELLLEKHSRFVFNTEIKREMLAKNHGYRLWSGDLSQGEIQARTDFMLEYVRRSETTLLIETDKFNRNMRERGEVVTSTKWSSSFYLRAIDAHALAPEHSPVEILDGETLNSTTKPLWKIMNARKNL